MGIRVCDLSGRETLHVMTRQSLADAQEAAVHFALTRLFGPSHNKDSAGWPLPWPGAWFRRAEMTPGATEPAIGTATCEDCGGRVVELRHYGDGVCFRHVVWCTNAACPRRGVMRSRELTEASASAPAVSVTPK